MNTYYTYLIGWSHLDRWYYGARVANWLPPEQDLWHIYKTSSKHVGVMVENHGDPDVIEVRRTFTNKKHAFRWEARVLKKLRAKQSPRWINKSNGNGSGENTLSTQQQHEARLKFLREKDEWLRYKTGIAIKMNINIPWAIRHKS